MSVPASGTYIDPPLCITNQDCFLVLTFVVLVTVSTLVIHFFKCRTFPIPEEDGGGDVLLLARDLSIDCEEPRYESMRVFAILMVLIYPVGIPAMYAVLLWGMREIFATDESLKAELAAGSPNIGIYAFLFEPFKRTMFYCEVIVSWEGS